MKKQSVKLKKSKKKVGSLESELNKAKLALTATNLLKVDLATTEEARDACYAPTTQTQNEATTTGAQGDKTL